MYKRQDYHKIQINGDTVTIAPDMLVDLGSVGKGYTAEILAKLMKENGVTSALFSLSLIHISNRELVKQAERK